MNCARMGCGHPETLHDANGKCWACACERLIFAAQERCPACFHPEHEPQKCPRTNCICTVSGEWKVTP